MGEIRSPYFSMDQQYLEDDAEMRSPYFSSGGDYLEDNAEIYSPFSFGTGDYHGYDARINSPYFSVSGYYGEDAEIPHETFFQQNIVENPYNADKFVEQDIVQTIYRTDKFIRRRKNAHDFFKELEDSETYPKDETCIYRVPDAFRKSNEAIYTPQEISIGPIHHRNKNLRPMEKQKKIYVYAFCNRMAEKTREEKIDFLTKLLETIKCYKENILRCYENKYRQFKGNEFEKMVLFDAAFIFEYFLRSQDRTKYVDDVFIRKNKFRDRIGWDLMLLENQLPFFILEKLYGHLVEEGEGIYTSFRDLAHEYFNRHLQIRYKPSHTEHILHFTDLVRSLLSFKHPDVKTVEQIGKFYSATSLHEAAIKIKESPRSEGLLDIKNFSRKGELRIPCLQINKNTGCLFGNLMALEQCHYKGEAYVCHYVKLFHILVAKTKDADLLIENKIIETNGNGAAVKNVIDKLWAEAFEDYSCYQTLYKQLDQYYQSYWVKNTAYFRVVYFGNIWKGTATISATLLLLFSFAQVIFSVVSLR